MTDQEQKNISWIEALEVYGKPQVLVMLFLGFSAGLPFLLVFGTLLTWLKETDLNIAVIGYFSWVGITYSIKMFWAPVIDNLRLPVLCQLLGHRRSWILIAQLGIALGLILMSINNPETHTVEMAVFALLVAFSSATQDINIDAYRIESADSRFQAAMAAMYILGYRIAVLLSSAGALYLAQFWSWSIAYFTMAICMAIGVVTVLLIKEPGGSQSRDQIMPREVVLSHFRDFNLAMQIILFIGMTLFLILFFSILAFVAGVFPVSLVNALLAMSFDIRLFDLNLLVEYKTQLLWVLIGISIIAGLMLLILRNQSHVQNINDWILGAVAGPFVDFFYRFGLILALMVLALISIYRITDIFMASMAYTLYIHLGFEKVEIANVTKLFGFLMTLSGAALGGILVMKYNIMRPLLLGAILVVITNLLFSVLSIKGHDLLWLTIVIGADNISAGLAQSAFIAYLSALINKRYTATQYALFSSLMTLLGKFLSGFSGEIVEADGYFNFFLYASALGVPTIFLIIILIMRKHNPVPVEK